MANPQIEDGFTRLANEILDNIMKKPFNGSQFRIVMAVWRNTYGYRRKERELATEFIAEATEIHPVQVRRELKTLIDQNVITVTRPAAGVRPRTLSFNKHYNEWLPDVTDSLQLEDDQKRQSCNGLVTSDVTDSLQLGVTNPLPNKERKKSLKKGDIPMEEKLKFQDTVFLTLKQYEQLCNEYGKERVDLYIEKLDEWQTNKKPSQHKKDHNKTIRVWIKDDIAKKAAYQQQKQLSPSEREAALQQRAAEEREKRRRKEEGIELDIDIVSEEEA